MAITKQIIFKGDATDAVNAADQVADSFKKVDKEAGKANKQIEDVTSNGGAIAILDRLTGGLASQFRDAFEATKLFNGSLKATRGALIATGIGALVVALGTIVAYWDEIVDFITQANKKLEEQKVLLKSNEDLLSAQIERIRAEEDLREIRGQSIDDLILKEKELLKRRIANRKEVVKTREEELKLAIQRFNEITAGEKFLQFFGVDARSKEDLQAIKELRASAAEARKELAEAEKELIELEDRTAVVITAKPKPKPKEEAQTREPVKTVADDLLSLNELANQARVESAKTVADQILSIEQEATEGLKALSDDLTEKRLDNLAREKIIEQTKRDLAMNTLSLIGQLAEEGSAVGKGVAIGQTIISTIEGVQAAYTTAQKSPITLGFPAYPYIQAGLAGAFGAAQVKKILQTDPSTGSGGNIGDVGGGGGGAAAPSFNLVRGTGENQLLEGITRQQNPIEAYVVSDRVTSSAALNRNRASEASLG